MAGADRSITETFARERGRLRGFIRRYVADSADAEDILQEVFYELVETVRLMRPVEQVGAWLFRVARNRIIDLFRRNRTANIEAPPVRRTQDAEDSGEVSFEDLLPAADAGPEAAYARQLLLEELDEALDELPAEQRSVFVGHELEGRSFKELADEAGVSVNTLLARKRYAVLFLRRRLQDIYNEFFDTGGTKS